MQRRIIIALTLMAAGRAMTLAFIARAGDGGPGDPPAAWLMPLVADAGVGLAALVIAWLLITKTTPGIWLAAIVWSSIGAFDAAAAGLVHASVPWDAFFMVRIFGPSMFVMAVALHVAIVVLLLRPQVRDQFGVSVLIGDGVVA